MSERPPRVVGGFLEGEDRVITCTVCREALPPPKGPREDSTMESSMLTRKSSVYVVDMRPLMAAIH